MGPLAVLAVILRAGQATRAVLPTTALLVTPPDRSARTSVETRHIDS
jgi:hypothetical protein